MFEHVIINKNGEKKLEHEGKFLMERFGECDEL